MCASNEVPVLILYTSVQNAWQAIAYDINS